MKEIWKDIAGYEGLYQVSNMGKVKRLPSGKRIRKNTKNINGKILQSFIVGGYLRVGLCRNGKKQLIFVHRLVAIAFIPNHDNKPIINHKNGIKTDNRSVNIEWCTYAENNRHAFETGLWLNYGENAYNAKFTNKDVLKIRQRVFKGELQHVIAKDYGTTQQQISKIKNKVLYKYV